MCVEHAGKMTHKCELDTQYGFRKGVSFLQNTFLRETTSLYYHYKRKKLYFLSTDISNAFCCTLRWLQLFQLSASGEKGKILLFSKNVYSNTNFIIKGDDGKHSVIIGENRGGTHGGLFTPPNFKLYTLPLQRAIENSETKVEVAGVKVNTSAVATVVR